MLPSGQAHSYSHRGHRGCKHRALRSDWSRDTYYNGLSSSSTFLVFHKSLMCPHVFPNSHDGLLRPHFSFAATQRLHLRLPSQCKGRCLFPRTDGLLWPLPSPASLVLVWSATMLVSEHNCPPPTHAKTC